MAASTIPTPIEAWMLIADIVQELEFKDYENSTFKRNLLLLRKKIHEVSDTNLLLDTENILQAIYDEKVGINKKKSTFYETIYALNDLGVKTISFGPLLKDFYLATANIKGNNINTMWKTYTDGSFCISHTYNIIYPAKNTSYILSLQINKNPTKILESHTHLVRFDIAHKLPHKQEVVNFSAPNIQYADNRIISWNEAPLAQEVFDTFDLSNSSFAKRLVKANEHYYTRK